MNPHERTKRYVQLVAVGTVLLWTVLCFFVIVSPRLRKLNRVHNDVTASSKKLAAMRREIDDASIAGPVVVGASRFEKFGILGSDEEQLFLTDLIDFCTDTKNTLNLVRRADVGRPTQPAPQGQQQKRSARAGSAQAPAAGEVPQPVIQRVPHTVTFSGTFLSSFYLLRKLESYKRLLTVERVEVGADTRLGYPRVNGNIIIDLYLVQTASTSSAQQEGATTSQPAAAGERQGPPEAGAAEQGSAEEPGHEV